jgi:hypothetical protein
MKRPVEYAQWKKNIEALDSAILAFDAKHHGGDRVKVATDIINEAISLRAFLKEAEAAGAPLEAIVRE